MKSLAEQLVRLARRWRSAGLALRAGADDALFAALENELGHALPDEFARYLRAIDGMEAGRMDNELFHFLTLDEMRAECAAARAVGAAAERADRTTESRRAPYSRLVFADWSLAAHEYALELHPARRGQMTLVGGAKPTRIADSFDAFLDLYLNDARELYGAQPRHDDR